ncbi:dihydrolipoyl dehydrogenase [Geosporobacter ferrireducens]|uniref:dihydrolipoyl dehydrogenase n=1 Tax=Geosporobacter ferrireducens TaxID=1424294 RepID=UPI00139E5BAA|nr:dihydrolipoyl dehydrogenase [Geosporobacter ferrireducens]MTI57948.1 dihydrolipoyl dehydrogenase [Geosporobacter ferrireducens]
MATKEIMPQADRTMEYEAFDVVVIGGGPAGYVAAIKVAQLGGKAALVEQDTVGGTCLNRGCIPTKTYLKNAELIEYIQQAARRGIIIENPAICVDMEKVVENKNDVVTMLTTGVEGLLKAYGVKLYKGTGRIAKNKEVLVDEKKLLKGKKIILAAGSKPAVLETLQKEEISVLDSDKILDLKEIPKQLAIIGGGVIGVEIAMIFRAYGSKVTILEMADRILPRMDKDLSAVLMKVFKKKGIRVITAVKVEDVQKEGNMTVLNLGEKGTLEATHILAAVGRTPNLEAIKDLGLAVKNGMIQVDDYMETSEAGIYAPGDVNGRSQLAHAAFKMGEIAAANALGHKEKIKLDIVPNCVYTTPEIGTVGLTEEEAAKRYDISVGKFFFGANGRALASGEKIGFVKVIADSVYGEILGVHIIGPGAAEMINEAAALMDMQITVYEASKIIHGHPTFSEAFMEACADCIGQSIHLIPKG